MDKQQALNSFWSSFSLTAYDENSVPSNAVLPYITYETVDSSFGYEVPMSASIWYRSSSWKDITEKSNQISSAIGMGGVMCSYDDGVIWIKRGSPFSRRMSDSTDDSIRRIAINISAEYLSIN